MTSMRTQRKLNLALLAVGATMLVGRSGHAYDSGTHHSIAAYGWEVMRAAADPQFGNHIAWKNNAPPPALSQVGTCDLCGAGDAQQGWNDFLTKIPASMARINMMRPGTEVV